MHLPTRIRIIIMLLAMLLVGVMFIAATCTYCRSDGVCVTVYSDGHACVYVRIGDGADMMCGGGSSNGGGGGPAATPTPTPLPLDPPIQQLATGQYSYGDTATHCTGIDVNIVDPISLVVHIDQHAAAVLNTSPYVEDHVSHHGWDLGSSANQYFHNGLGLPPPPEECVIGVISLADGDDTTSRNHTRGHTQDEVVAWGYGGPWTMTALTPHYDQRISTTCWHAVPESVNPPGTPEYSGLSAARDTLISHWLLDEDAQHRYVLQASFWGNSQRVPQCNAPDGDPAQWQPRSDGWVYFLGVCEVHSAVVTPC